MLDMRLLGSTSRSGRIRYFDAWMNLATQSTQEVLPCSTPLGIALSSHQLGELVIPSHRVIEQLA